MNLFDKTLCSNFYNLLSVIIFVIAVVVAFLILPLSLTSLLYVGIGYFLGFVVTILLILGTRFIIKVIRMIVGGKYED